MSENFKTCLFGGFDREDVISYIERTAREARDRIQELNESNEALRRENETLAQQLASLGEISEKYGSVSEEYAAVCAQRDELLRRVEELDTQVRLLRGNAEEYRSLKDHIAEIEISAHRRTEEFRAQAIARLHDLINQQRIWYDQRREQYTALHEGIQYQIQAAQNALGPLDLSGFEKLDQELRELDASLNK